MITIVNNRTGTTVEISEYEMPVLQELAYINEDMDALDMIFTCIIRVSEYLFTQIVRFLKAEDAFYFGYSVY